MKNTFITGTGTITAEDILIDPTTSYGRGGRIYAGFNKFGGEGENANRIKVRAFNAITTNRSTDVTFSKNQFHGAAFSEGGISTAFKLDNPHVNWSIDDNEFDDMDVIVNDAFTSATGQFGGSYIGRNRYFNSTRQMLKLFENGGRGFTRVDEPQMGAEWGVAQAAESIEARNRLSYSSSLTNWNKAAGVTITGGQTDPYGGTDAALFTRDGLSVAQYFFRAIDQTTGGAWATDSLIIKFWAKAGTANQIIVGFRDVTDSVWGGSFQYLSLTDTWKQYTVKFNGLDNTHAYQFWSYIQTNTVATGVSGGVYFSHPQSSEYPSDYVPTPVNIGVADTEVGKRFNRSVGVGDGAWNGGHLKLGAYHLWVDATGDLRIKSTAPTSDTDGAVVGTQS